MQCSMSYVSICVERNMECCQNDKSSAGEEDGIVWMWMIPACVLSSLIGS